MMVLQRQLPRPRLSRRSLRSLRIGIDASNIRAGGGVTHLVQLLKHVDRAELESLEIIVWAGRSVLDLLPDRQWLIRRPIATPGSLWARAAFQQLTLPSEIETHRCDVLFSPGGIVARAVSVPFFVLSQNLLPFELKEALRFGLASREFLRYSMIRSAQLDSLRRAQGALFLTNYARKVVSQALGPHNLRTKVVPHGIERRFLEVVRTPAYTGRFRVLYVSIINFYKHQVQVARAARLLRSRGVPIEVEFVGPAHPRALLKFRAEVARLDPDATFLHYRGPLPFQSLHEAYATADAFVFASSCENMPNILVEAMAAGLPIACSDRGPMPEILTDAGLYFDPEQAESIADALLQLYERPGLAEELSRRARAAARQYSWERCARETFEFAAEIARDHRSLGSTGSVDPLSGKSRVEG